MSVSYDSSAVGGHHPEVSNWQYLISCSLYVIHKIILLNDQFKDSFCAPVFSPEPGHLCPCHCVSGTHLYPLVFSSQFQSLFPEALSPIPSQIQFPTSRSLSNLSFLSIYFLSSLVAPSLSSIWLFSPLHLNQIVSFSILLVCPQGIDGGKERNPFKVSGFILILNIQEHQLQRRS